MRPSDLHLVLAQLRRYANSVRLPLLIWLVASVDRPNFFTTAFSMSLKWAVPPSSLITSTTTGASSDGDGNLVMRAIYLQKGQW